MEVGDLARDLAGKASARLDHPRTLVFAGNHGVAARSAFRPLRLDPAQMVRTSSPAAPR
jgi:hypothetical protein